MGDVLVTLAFSGFLVALVHASLPTHWLPFVLAGRAQGWGLRRTLAIVASVGTLHVLFTTVLGGIIVLVGAKLSQGFGHVFVYFASGALFVIGIYYIVRQITGSGHEHHHSVADVWGGQRGEHVEDSEFAAASRKPSERIAIGSLVAMLTLSPCESFLPVYLMGSPFGLQGFAVLSITLAVATLASMVALTAIATLGMRRIRTSFIEHYERGIVGGLLCALGVLVFLIEG